jgi:uncharacterized protein (TIGR03067 family)
MAVPPLAAQKTGDQKGDRERLIGDWKVVLVKTVDVPRQFGRQDYSEAEAEFAKATCRITADRIVFTVDAKERTATLTIDETQSPKAIDLSARVFPIYQKNTKMLGIYEINGDRLKLSFDPRNTPRPTQFRPTGKDGQLSLFLIELERVNPGRKGSKTDKPDQ